MNNTGIVLVGLKHRVTAVSTGDGVQLWSTELTGSGLGANFVTLISDTTRVYAYSNGYLHCLDLATGAVLWTNNLPGHGYGLGTVCLPGIGSAPDVAAIQKRRTDQNAAAGSTTSSSAVS